MILVMMTMIGRYLQPARYVEGSISPDFSLCVGSRGSTAAVVIATARKAGVAKEDNRSLLARGLCHSITGYRSTWYYFPSITAAAT